MFSCCAVFSTQAVIKEDNPHVLFEKVTSQAFSRFKQEWPQVEQNPEQLKVIIREELLPYIDYQFASFKVLGSKNFRKLSPEQRIEFTNAFKDYIVSVYAGLFINYRSEQKIVIQPGSNTNLPKEVTVRSKIVEAGRPDISVSFQLRQGETGWKAYDMEAEGISVLSSKSKEINVAISRIGIKGVIQDLNEKANKKLIFKDKNAKKASDKEPAA